MATTIAALQARADQIITALDDDTREELRAAGAVVCVAGTDVHEYGKILLEAVLERLDMQVIDCGIAADPDAVARRARDSHADAIAISTYNGIALAYLRSLREELQRLHISPLIFIGGCLNQIPDNSPNSMPVDVSKDLENLGAYVCWKPEDMLAQLRELVEPRSAPQA